LKPKEEKEKRGRKVGGKKTKERRRGKGKGPHGI